MMNNGLPRENVRGRIYRAEFSRRDFYRLLGRHRWKMATTCSLVFFGALAISLLSPKQYQSQSLLYVQLGRENVRLDPTITLGQTPMITIPASRENEINSVVEILRSRILAEKVVDALGAEKILDSQESSESLGNQGESNLRLTSIKSYVKKCLEQIGLTSPIGEREQAIQSLRKSFSAEPFPKSDMLSLAYRAKSPELAQEVLRQITELYMDEHLGLNRTPNSHHFLKEQTKLLLDQLTATEEKLQKFKKKTGLVAPDNQREFLAARLNRLQEELLSSQALIAATTTEIQVLTEKVESLSTREVTAKTTGLGNPAADGMRQLLYNLQLQEQKMAAELAGEHIALKSIREQIVQAKAILAQEQEQRSTSTEGPSRAHEDLNLTRLRQEALLQSLQAKVGILQEQLVSAQNDLQQQIQDDRQLATLQREVQLQDASYRKHRDNLEQAHIEHALDAERISNIKVIQPASYSEKPVGPNALLNLAAGLVGGLLAGVGLAVLCESLDHSLKTPEDIESRLNLPLFVSIPHLDRSQLALQGKPGV